MAEKNAERGIEKLLTDFDKYLLGEGTYERAYEKMGAHLVELSGRPMRTRSF